MVRTAKSTSSCRVSLVTLNLGKTRQQDDDATIDDADDNVWDCIMLGKHRDSWITLLCEIRNAPENFAKVLFRSGPFCQWTGKSSSISMERSTNDA